MAASSSPSSSPSSPSPLPATSPSSSPSSSSAPSNSSYAALTPSTTRTCPSSSPSITGASRANMSLVVAVDHKTPHPPSSQPPPPPPPLPLPTPKPYPKSLHSHEQIRPIETLSSLWTRSFSLHPSSSFPNLSGFLRNFDLWILAYQRSVAHHTGSFPLPLPSTPPPLLPPLPSFLRLLLFLLLVPLHSPPSPPSTPPTSAPSSPFFPPPPPLPTPRAPPLTSFSATPPTPLHQTHLQAQVPPQTSHLPSPFPGPRCPGAPPLDPRAYLRLHLLPQVLRFPPWPQCAYDNSNY